MTADTDDLDVPELPRGVALAWGIASNPQRGPKREMSIERIVETAVELADRDGLGAVSMAAVAKELGFTPMSLYRYVSAKDDLLLLMQEEVTGLPPAEYAAENGWRAQIEVLYRAQVMRYLEHPWLLSLPIHGSPITPNNAAWMDAYLTVLDAAPLTPDERHATMLAMLGHARWYGIVTAGYTEGARLQGLTVEEISERDAAIFAAVVHADEYPRLKVALDAGVMRSDSDPFAFGVATQLDGVQAVMDARAAAPDQQADAVATASEPIDALDPRIAADKRYRAADRSVREAEKALHGALRARRQALREAQERISTST